MSLLCLSSERFSTLTVYVLKDKYVILNVFYFILWLLDLVIYRILFTFSFSHFSLYLHCCLNGSANK